MTPRGVIGTSIGAVRQRVGRFVRAGRAFVLYHCDRTIPSRHYLPHLMNAMGLHGAGAEIGVAEGGFSETLLRASKLSVLYSVDPWTEFPAHVYEDMNNIRQSDQDARYARVVARLGVFGDRSNIVRATSIEASRMIPDGSLDLVFIDANHKYEAAAADIAAWWPKVRLEGLFAGHDYLNEIRPGRGVYGVKRAVDEFVHATGQRLHVTRELWPTWYVVKSTSHVSH